MHISTRILCSIGGLVSLGALGCQTDLTETAEGVESSALTSENGLTSINGLTLTNGLAVHNGLTLTNGLAVHNGLSDTEGLITTPDGRNTITYLVRCALPSGHSIAKTYGSTTYTFSGLIGLAPSWETGSCDLTCQDRVSSCMLALVNTTGVHVPLWLTGPMSQIGWGQSASYPDLEGAFFANIFAPNPSTGKMAAYFCEGPGQIGLVPGRIGADQPGSPYTNPWGAGARCGDSNHCSTSGVPSTNGKPDGYSSCNGHPAVTVWRNAAASPVFDVKLKYMLKNVKSAKMIDWDDVGSSMAIQQWTASGNTNQQWQFNPEPNNTYHISSIKAPTQCLQLPAGQTAAGTAVQMAPCNGAPNQSWTVKTSNGASASAYGQYFKFSNLASPTTGFLEVPTASTVNGTRLDIAAFTPTTSQVWSVSVAP
jgi:hypothetical protein